MEKPKSAMEIAADTKIPIIEINFVSLLNYNPIPSCGD